jgi:nitroreductase
MQANNPQGTLNPLTQLLDARISTRKFQARAVPRADIETLLALAQRTPSWCNIQPWQVAIVSGAALERLRERLYAHAASGVKPNPDFAFPPAYEGVHRARRKVCGVQLYEALGIGKDDRAAAARQSLENFHMFGAPHLALITVDDYLGFYGAFDCGLYVMSFMLAAQSLGIDTIAQAALASYPEVIRDELALPQARKFICGISFGYGERDDPIHAYRTERAALGEAVRFIDSVKGEGVKGEG